MKNINTKLKTIVILSSLILILVVAALGIKIIMSKSGKSDNSKTNSLTESNIQSDNNHSDGESEKENSIQTISNNTKKNETETIEETQETTTTSILDANVQEETDPNVKVVYLTFDDGPSTLTPQYLDVLRQYGVKATFFVTYQPDLADTYKQIIADGNKIQIHTATHDFNNIYASFENYFEDFNTVYNFVVQTTGEQPDSFRFPGGSNTGYAKNVAIQIANEMSSRGYNFYDWNVSVGDGSSSATADSIIQKIQVESDGKTKIVMLAHDSVTKSETLAALPQVIQYYIDNGYKFGIIDKNVNSDDFQFLTWH